MELISEPLAMLAATGLRLRDFFIASEPLSLVTAYSVLNPGDVVNAQTLEYDFNALFVGPQALKAAPYASVYLDEEALVLGKTTLELREFMQCIGLEIEGENVLPDDHIAYTLELTVLLISHFDKHPEYKAEIQRYMNVFVMSWVPLFIAKINENAQTPAMKHVATILSHWLDDLHLRVSL